MLEACKLLKQFRYIHDILLMLQDSREAITFNKAIDTIFNRMGMKVTKYVTNSPESLPIIRKQDRNPTPCIELQHNESSEQLGTISDTTKVVGLSWEPGNDTFNFEQYRKLHYK